jgi:hypothetical protein
MGLGWEGGHVVTKIQAWVHSGVPNEQVVVWKARDIVSLTSSNLFSFASPGQKLLLVVVCNYQGSIHTAWALDCLSRCPFSQLEPRASGLGLDGHLSVGSFSESQWKCAPGVAPKFLFSLSP